MQSKVQQASHLRQAAEQQYEGLQVRLARIGSDVEAARQAGRTARQELQHGHAAVKNELTEQLKEHKLKGADSGRKFEAMQKSLSSKRQILSELTAELGAAEENLLQQRQRYESELSAQSEAVQQVALACDESSQTLQSLESDLVTVAWDQ